MRTRSLLLFMTLLFVTLLPTEGQDIHFSQFYNTPTFYNPANAGVFDGDLRCGLHYKNQWNSLPKGYNTYAFTLDGSIMVKNEISYKKNYIGYGFYVLRDQAGDLDLSNLETMFNLNYNLELGSNDIDNHNLGMGINIGFDVRSFNPLNAQWGTQWNSTFRTFDPTINPEEYVFTERKLNLDLGFGLVYVYNKDKFRPFDKFHFELGLASTRLNVPKYSYFSNDTAKTRIQPKITAHAMASIPVLSNELFLIPGIITSFQQKHFDINMGMSLKYYFKSMGFARRSKSKYDLICNLGIYYRLLNSVAVLTGFEYGNSIYGNFGLNFSYDITFSKLSDNNKFNGGPEISLTYSV